MGIGAAIISAAVATAFSSTVTILGLTFTGFSAFLVRAALGIALNALTPKPKSQGANRGYQVTTRGSALDHQIIYGRMRVGGVIVHEETTGNSNKFLHRIIAVAGHEIESFDEVFLDDEKIIEGGSVVADNKFENVVRVNFHTGSPDQLADSDLVSESESGWSSAHRLRGVAYLYVRLKFNQDKFPNGIPEISTTVKGKKVYDPRTDTTAWSDNPALCLRDYLTSGYGLGEDSTAIDDTLVSAAADVCDETDTLSGEKRYTCNGAFVTQVTPYDILGDLLTSMGGLLWFAQGEWRIKPAYYVAPTITLTEDDLRSSIAVKTRHTRRDNYNTVRGTFRGEESNWQVTDYPDVTNSAFLAADNNQESVIDLELPFTDNSEEARRIARIALERNRQQLTVSAAFGLRAFSVQTGDIVQLSIDRFGWTNKEFEVTNWTFGLTDGLDLQVNMVLREISESVFDEVDDGIIYERDNTNLLSPFEVPNIGINASATTQVLREKLTNVINVIITSGGAERIDFIEVEYKPSEEADYINVGSGELGLFRIVDLETGIYDIRARAVNTFGVRGDWENLVNISADGLLQPPSDVTGFTSEINGATLQLEWDAIPDLDLSYYRVRYTPNTTATASWANSVNYSDKVPRPATSVAVPARAGTFLIKGVDKSGVESANATSLVVNADDLESLTTTLTQTEDPTFSGTKTDLVVVDNALKIADVTLFDDLAGNVDSLSGNWDDLGVAIAVGESGVYEFSDVIDIGSIKRARVRVDATTLRFNGTGNTFDDLVGKVDSLPSLWDDLTSEGNFADTNVKAFVSTTNDDPLGTPTWSDYSLVRVKDISARAFRFKVEFTTNAAGITPTVTELDAVVQHN